MAPTLLSCRPRTTFFPILLPSFLFFVRAFCRLCFSVVMPPPSSLSVFSRAGCAWAAPPPPSLSALFVKMVRDYTCLWWATMFHDRCFFHDDAPRKPCRSYCVQVGLVCANDPFNFLGDRTAPFGTLATASPFPKGALLARLGWASHTREMDPRIHAFFPLRF
jgi:hypothetical protein